MRKKKWTEIPQDQLVDKMVAWAILTGNTDFGNFKTAQFFKDLNIQDVPLKELKGTQHIPYARALYKYQTLQKGGKSTIERLKHVAEDMQKYLNAGGQFLWDCIRALTGAIHLSEEDPATAAENALKSLQGIYTKAWDAGTTIGTEIKEQHKAQDAGRQEFVADKTVESLKEPYVQGEFEKHVKQAEAEGANLRDKGELITLRKQYGSKQRLGNHPEWYGQYPEILPNALNFGVRKEANGFDTAIGASVKTRLVIPQKDGAVSQAYKDAVRAIFIKLRGSNNGAFNYDDVDVAAYIEIARGIYALYHNLNRDLKLINNLDPYISKTPEPILALAGYSSADYADLRDNRANHIIRLNQLAHKIEITLPIPPSMTVFERDRYISTSVVEEGKGPKSSLYVYSLKAVTTADSGQDLTDQVISGTMTQRIDMLDSLINAIYGYTNATYGPQTLVKIAGDMIKAYGDKAFKTLPLNSEAEKCAVIRDEYLLNQIQNNNMIQYDGNGFSVNNGDAYNINYTYDYAIDGTDGIIDISVSDLRGVVNNSDTTFIINRNSGNISNLECISLTRGNFTVAAITSPKTGNTYTSKVYDCGTDLIDEFRYYYFEEGTNDIKNIVFNAGTRFAPLAATLWGQVDFSPILTAYPATNKAYHLLDLDTYAFCSLTQFQVMNDAAVLSEYKTVAITSQVNFKTARK